MKKFCFIFLMAFVCMPFFAENLVDVTKVNFVLADKSKGSEILLTEDDFTDHLSAFDMAARMKTSRKVSKAEYLEFVGMQAEDWSEEESVVMLQVIEGLKEKLSGYKINLPETVYFVKTTGLEEGDSAYCRGQNAVVASKSMIGTDVEAVLKLYTHEIFHIFSKNNLKVREALYNQIGFYKTGDLSIPEQLAAYKITNPDSVLNNYYFKAVVKGEKINVMPLLIAVSDYDETKGGEFFNYMQLVFVEVNPGKKESSFVVKNNRFSAFSAGQISNLFTSIGMNTNYIIHAEEILADNFVFMINGDRVKSPEIIEKMKKILKK